MRLKIPSIIVGNKYLIRRGYYEGWTAKVNGVLLNYFVECSLRRKWYEYKRVSTELSEFKKAVGEEL